MIFILFFVTLSGRIICKNLDVIKGRYTRSATDFEVIVPTKITKRGSFNSNYLPHFYELNSNLEEFMPGRKKRSVENESVHYSVPISNVNHHIELIPNSDFLSSGMIVEDHLKELNTNRSKINIRKIRSTQCHYQGFVRGKTKSRVALSTCYGLAGFISFDGNDYLIEPADKVDENDEQHYHVIYKRSTTSSNITSPSNCGTTGSFKEAFKERIKWENIYGTALEQRNRRSSFAEKYLKNSTSVLLQKKRNTKTSNCPPKEPGGPVTSALYLETMITIDPQFIENNPDEDIETLILTIFNMVATNFRDASLGQPIEIKLVRLIFLTYEYPELDVRRYSPQKLLENFCFWQMNFNPRRDEHPNHHDFAIFMTKFEPCQGVIYGVTNMASICRPSKACTVIHDSGLLSANIITHQIGHSLGAEHDDGENGGCASEEPDGTKYHMAPKITAESTEWSVCSRHCIGQFMMTHAGWCLTDIPTDHDFSFPDVLPGQIYSSMEQCYLIFRINTSPCKIGHFCKMLFCQVSPTQCVSTGQMPAFGTPCAADMWCYNGICVHRGQRPGAVNGEWSEWGEWSSCTRSCGGGVQTAYRTCTNPPPGHSGRYCTGPWIRHRMCSTWMCEGASQSFADLQCRMTEDRYYQGRRYQWIHFTAQFRNVPCSLICINEMSQVVMRSPIVIDGTPCNPGHRDVCIEGKCRNVGCDWVIDSYTVEDGCGVCHGNGTSCRIIFGSFLEKNVTELTPFLKLPVGTSMIYVREQDPSECHIAIADSINSTFYLNSPSGGIQLPGSISIGGGNGVYETKSNIERLFIRTPIEVPITVYIYCTESFNLGVRYQYALPEYDRNYIPSYHWRVMGWEPCSYPCGGGVQRARSVCIEELGGEVDDKFCDRRVKPEDVIRSCNNFPCVAKWWVGPWSECECENGEGIAVRIVLCMRSQDEDGVRAEVVHEKECYSQPKPKLEKPCNATKAREKVLMDQCKTSMKRSPQNFLNMSKLKPFKIGNKDELEDKEYDEWFHYNIPNESVKNALNSPDYDLFENVINSNTANKQKLRRMMQKKFDVTTDIASEKKQKINVIKFLPKTMKQNSDSRPITKDMNNNRNNKVENSKKFIKKFKDPELVTDESLNYYENRKKINNKLKKNHYSSDMSAVKNHKQVKDLNRLMNNQDSKVTSDLPINTGYYHNLFGHQYPEGLTTQYSVYSSTDNKTHINNHIKDETINHNSTCSIMYESTKSNPEWNKAKVYSTVEPGTKPNFVENKFLNKQNFSADFNSTLNNTKSFGKSSDIYMRDPAITVSTNDNKCLSTEWNIKSHLDNLILQINGSTCSPIKSNDQEEEVAEEYTPRLETMDLKEYKLFIAPIEPTKRNIPQTDAEYQLMGVVQELPVGSLSKVIPMMGNDLFKTIVEAKKHGTPRPSILADEMFKK